MSRRKKRRVKEMEFIPLPQKHTPWADSIMSWVIWGAEGEKAAFERFINRRGV